MNEHGMEKWTGELERRQQEGDQIRLIDENTGAVTTATVPYAGRVEFDLHNLAGEKVTVRLYIGNDLAWLGVEGYGSSTEADDQGVQVGIDAFHLNAPASYYDDYHHPNQGEAQLLVWDDINEEEPQEIVSFKKLRSIPLAQARLERREEWE